MAKLASGIEYEIKGRKMVITIDLDANPDKTTSSGKNHMIATTGPVQSVPEIEGAKIGINFYEPIK